MDAIKGSDETEDSQKKLSDDVQKLTDDMIKRVDTMLSDKESDIMTV